MAYTPELSQANSSTLRRIAWALGMPMTQAMEKVFEEVVQHIDRHKVCTACKDKTQCAICAFGSASTKTETKAAGCTPIPDR
jgi:recombinational DNA repair protein RecR